MNLESFDGKCVRITTASGDVYEGIASYYGREYTLSEYGQDQEALRLNPVIFYEDDILNVISLEDVDGPFGHYSEKYGLLETKCLVWGTDLIEEVFDSDADIQKLRMLACMNDNFRSLIDRVVPGRAPWRSGKSILESETDENEQGPVYLEELENMLDTLVKHNKNAEIIKEAKGLLERLATYQRKNSS